MSRLVVGTNWASLDEPCYSLSEMLGPAADGKSLRRWQTIQIVRNDRVVELRRDLGPAHQFRAAECVIPGGAMNPRTGRIYIEETVGRLVDVADRLRAETPPPLPETIDLVRHYLDQSDIKRRRRKALSQFGPRAVIQRS